MKPTNPHSNSGAGSQRAVARPDAATHGTRVWAPNTVRHGVLPRSLLALPETTPAAPSAGGFSGRKPCKRGMVAERDKRGQCLCVNCVAFRRSQWRKKNAERHEYKKAWLLANPEKSSEYGRRWRQGNAEKRREIEKSWRSRNRDKVKEYNAKAGRKWSQSNPGKRLASVRSRQLAKKNRTPPWVCKAALAAIYERAASITSTTGVPHEVDHIIPLQGETVSGLHVPWNLQILPRAQNRSKGNRL